LIFFFPWPEDALIETSKVKLSKEKLGANREIYVEDESMKDKLFAFMSKIHKHVIEVSTE
jgi:hypothetical protein